MSYLFNYCLTLEKVDTNVNKNGNKQRFKTETHEILFSDTG